MIISHKYKFIFIKTRKVAGSSIEKFLYPYLDHKTDVLTGSPSDGVPQLNLPKILKKPNGSGAGHASYKHAKQILQNNIKDYFIFSAERNPWDKCISSYKFHKSIGNVSCGINEFISLEKIRNKQTNVVFSPLPLDWPLYTYQNKVITNKIIKFENINNDLQEIIAHLSIPANINDFTSIRLKQTAAKQYTLNKQSINKIHKLFSREINYFNYTYEC